MLVTGIGVVCLHENPALHRARSVPTLPGLALRERRTRFQELLGSNFVVAGLERPVHQKGLEGVEAIEHSHRPDSLSVRANTAG